jgi:hypothetical protein
MNKQSKEVTWFWLTTFDVTLPNSHPSHIDPEDGGSMFLSNTWIHLQEFADDASVLISQTNPLHFKNTLNVVYGILNDWFVKNLLSLNKVKTWCINFIAKNN